MFINHTNLAAVTFDTLDRDCREHHVVVISGTYSVTADSTVTLAEDQPPPLAAAQFVGSANHSSLRRESDFAPFKPACDVTLDATAYAPGGKPAKVFVVAIRIFGPPRPRPIPPKPYGPNQTMPPSPAQLDKWEREVAAIKANPFQSGPLILEKKLYVCGPHKWVRGILGWSLTAATTIASLPLRYEYTFGGTVTVYDFEHQRDRTGFHPANPLGVGYWPEWAHDEAKRRKRIPAPQVFFDRDLTFGNEHAPQGFGPICGSWQPRLGLAGSYNEKWQKGRWPNIPEDFDPAYWNCAHPDLIVPYLNGDEEVQLQNLTPSGQMKFRLPGHEPYVLVRYQEGEIDEVRPHLDTLFIEPDKGKFSIVWRAVIASEPKIRKLELRMKSPERQHEPK